MKLIRKIYRKKAENREEQRIIAIKNVVTALAELKKEISFKEAYIFGSVTRPYQFNENSDIDIAFQKLDKDRLFYAVGFLSRFLNRDVNVVILEDIHFREKILNEGIQWKKD